jgi:hypothetical protein
MEKVLLCPNCPDSVCNHFYTLEVMQGTDDYLAINKIIVDRDLKIIKTPLVEKRSNRTRNGELEFRFTFSCENCNGIWTKEFGFHKGSYLENDKFLQKDAAQGWNIPAQQSNH